ncbi:uncharacterized protein LOC119189720 [Manduca sexta]|uniref:C2H2-type domain-containing protein n=1 Tax=Manduca sexta TaxID=7130 RepID=A0A922D123_MANSE|nr:uncharacterized protein LOC115453723 isoform X2 [Manduca sexta]XP_037296088.1 uncharacterized protein LOC119189720 [Manduca sexta]KAG6465292.1 hypothetical protein O3G_MSEX015058 [Manduca sexta]
MVEPEKPFACTIPDCGMTFTNEDHLHVHTKKHDMVLQLGLEQKAVFVADQTPTPTRFIRNCEEVGLFQDLQNVNPFEEGFKRAMEAKHNLLSLENTITTTSTTDELHTPQMFPLLDAGDTTLYSTTNNQRNITISRSSSDESGVIKEFETTTISKLTNEVTTISRVVEKHDDPKDEILKDGVRKDCISYNSATKVQTETKTEHMQKNSIQTLIYEDTIVKNNISKDVLLTDTSKLQLPDIPPIMSQKSIEYVVDSLTNDLCNESKKADEDKNDNYEVIIKLPNGRQVRMRSVEENERRNNAKEKLKEVLKEKDKPVMQKVCLVNNNVSSVPVVSNIVPITTGTLIPVTLVSPPTPVVPKIPIAPLKTTKVTKRPVKRRHLVSEKGKESIGSADRCSDNGVDDNFNKNKKFSDMESKCAASRRYRARLKDAWIQQAQENQQLKEENEKLLAEKAMLKLLIIEHMRKCPDADDFSKIILY